MSATVPPRPTHAPTAPARPRDWLDELFDETAVAPAPPMAQSTGRLPDWRFPKPALDSDDAQPVPDAPATDLDAHTEGDHPGESEEAPAEDSEPRDPWLRPHPGYYPTAPAILPTVQKAPAALSPKTRALLYNATSAGLGWGLGLGPALHHAIQSCGRDAGIGPALIIGVGSCLALAHIWDRRTRHWWIGLAWAARIPLATAITALALYAPASQI